MKEVFSVGLVVRVASADRPFHVADAGSRGGGMLSYFAALNLVSDDRIGLDTLCLSVEGNLLFNVAPLASASGVLDRRVPLSVLSEKADD